MSHGAMTRDQASAVTWLFVPGSRPDRFDKAAAAGADEVIIDLEDAVPAADKAGARTAAVRWLADGGRAWVRVNGADTEWFAEDIATLAASGARGLVLPKASTRALTWFHEVTPPGSRLPVLALIESAEGIRDVHQVADDPAVVALAFGAIDFALDLEADESAGVVEHARNELVIASRAAGLPGPVDGVCADVRDPATAALAARHGRSQGFAGKLCIHPSQVPAVAEAWQPSTDELAWAQRIAAAVEPEGVDLLDADPVAADLAMATEVDGQMVDRPVLLRARRILQRARPAGSAQDDEVHDHATT